MFEAPGRGVLLTAPHATRHRGRDGQVKLADAATGALGRVVAAATGAACLVTHGSWPGNANHDPLERCAFKQRVVHLITDQPDLVVVDLHGMRDDHGVDVCVGTHVDGPSPLADLVEASLAGSGLRCRRNDPFAARDPNTVTATVLGRRVPVVQLEVAARWRDPVDRTEDARAFLVALTRVATQIPDALAP